MTVVAVRIPPAADGGKQGLDDYFAAGGTVEDLRRRAAPPAAPSAPAAPLPAPQEWPASLDDAAFQGLAGEIVRAVFPHTEADEAGLLLTRLAAAGSIAGAGPSWEVSGRRHPLLVWPLLVGATAKGRKGTTWGTLLPILRRAEAEWAERCVGGGLSSGEGLIWALRDPVTKRDGGAEVVVDPGVAEKRLCLVEEEFSGTLRVAARDGNSLSAVLRKAWDAEPLRSLTKQSPAVATAPTSPSSATPPPRSCAATSTTPRSPAAWATASPSSASAAPGCCPTGATSTPPSSSASAPGSARRSPGP